MDGRDGRGNKLAARQNAEGGAGEQSEIGWTKGRERSYKLSHVALAGWLAGLA